MANQVFSQFVEDVFEATRNRTMDDKFLGIPMKKRSTYGRVYIGNSSPSFYDIEEHEKGENPMKTFLESFKIQPDMLYFQSHINNEEDQIYEYEYVSHEVKENEIIVKTKKKDLVFAI